jgi:hypothetical protein
MKLDVGAIIFVLKKKFLQIVRSSKLTIRLTVGLCSLSSAGIYELVRFVNKFGGCGNWRWSLFPFHQWLL